ncbi:peptide chain release factor N(5)-glutamine methyltransferase [Acetobacter estunensis]|uniref:peptide chain release factor N(5)-glutamine methyltransferase n=1 Tax=Acetobacter estunensis TaxID=104097 RepID=UPI0020C45735|nr:peptide chain release factor N(5)-glutamine methyltransferase [Acetobacter estunensis]
MMGKAALTVGEAIAAATTRLAVKAIEQPRREARLLFELASGHDVPWQLAHGGDTVSDNAALAYDALVARRAAGEPMAHLSGRQGFWTLDLEVSADTLVPRGDTETLIEALLDHRPDREAAYTFLDLGTGTGCLLLAALSEYTAAFGIGVDRVPEAALLAARNARRTGLDQRAAFMVSAWDAAVEEKRFDVILSNPPYIPSDDISGLMVEVSAHEPASALDGGADGLREYRYLIPALRRLLVSGGLAVIEIGIEQHEDVTRLARAVDLKVVDIRVDLGRIPRAVVLEAPSA